MKSAALTVDDFLREQPELVRMDLVQLRSIVRREAPDAIEGMKYGGPVPGVLRRPREVVAKGITC